MHSGSAYCKPCQAKLAAGRLNADQPIPWEVRVTPPEVLRRQPLPGRQQLGGIGTSRSRYVNVPVVLNASLT